MKIRPLMEAYEAGLCAWDDAKEQFEQVRVLWTKTDAASKQPPMPEGHPALWKDDEGKEWVLFGNPLPTLRCPATFEAWKNEASWQVLKPQESLKAAGTGEVV